MNLESHFACGWLIGNVVPGLARRDRLVLVLAAIASDLDGLSYLAGESAYVNWHHTVGHTVFFAAPLLLGAAWAATSGKRLLVASLALLALITHLAGDYFMSGWTVPILWPLDGPHLMFTPRMGLDHPLTIAMSYAGIALLAASLWIWGRSPLEFLWPSRDQLLARIARREKLACNRCGATPGLRKLNITWRNELVCKTCAKQSAVSPSGVARPGDLPHRP